MDCNNCNKSMDSISLAAHETIMAREDKKHRRLVWVIIVLIAALVVCNLAWLVTWNSYARDDGSSYERGYAEASNEMRNMLDSMLRDARTDQERKAVREMMDNLNVRGRA